MEDFGAYLLYPPHIATRDIIFLIAAVLQFCRVFTDTGTATVQVI